MEFSEEITQQSQDCFWGNASQKRKNIHYWKNKARRYLPARDLGQEKKYKVFDL